jgi:hypothetical protein
VEKLRRWAMKIGKEWKVLLFLLLLPFLIILLTECSLKQGVPQWSGSGFVRKEFLEFKNVAILPFEGDDSGEVSSAFALRFHEKFPEISIVDREQVLEAFRDQALNPDQLDEESRLRIGNTLGVQALIAGRIYYPSITRWLLQITILDIETGKMMGRSLVEINFMGAMGKEEAARFAVDKLTLW